MGGAGVVDTAETSIEVSGLVKRYGRKEALKGVDLKVRKGEIYGLIGPDGAGKSTLMRSAAGILAFDQGQVTTLGREIRSERTAEQIKDRLGYMAQGLGQNLYPELSVEENIDFFARVRMMSGGELQERKARLLEMTRLADFRDRPMKNLSGGMKQKLGLVCTLIHAPELLILDEPTTGVDPVSRREFWTILTELLMEQSITALVSTAYMDEASRFQRLSLLFEGRAISGGTPAEITGEAPGSIVLLQTESQEKALEELRDGFPQTEPYGSRIRVFVPDVKPQEAQNTVREHLQETRVLEIESRMPTLEDVFVSMLRRRELASVEHSVEIEKRKETASQDGPAIEARDLIREFGSFRAVDQVGFRVEQGEIFGLLGANGAGKTTVIKMLVGILPPTSGSSTVAGKDMSGKIRAVKQNIGYMSQVFSLYEDLTVRENIRLYGGIYGLSSRELSSRSKWVLRMADLQGYEDELSGGLPVGIRQRLALGCALVHRPRVLFLDEPTSGVDPVGRRHFWDILFGLSRKQGVAILITTHYMSEAEHCDHLALMYAGRVVADDTPDGMKQGVREEAGELLEIRSEQYLDVLRALDGSQFSNASLHGRSVHLLVKDPDEAASKIDGLLKDRGIEVDAVQTKPLSMEDVFVHRITSLEQEGR
ncbi:MAG: ATP-binding cassette domain-containing protein [Desulfovibrionales bacterium]